ncbi:MAG: chromosome segregation protein SMC [Dehalococcoidia bacterium]|nr:chromosome segregation protein SMC [Dehalococcoidia bacterium]
MYLKRLELQGFKSFASRTALEFSPGVTCIIGPNGVGKSNVGDAIRWVLGEHNSRALRARKLEEVIFSGSSVKSPVGMAEVDLILDNSDGALPIDFTEVRIGRRAFRDGQSEYLLNGNRVRLREIQDLFAGAHVGHGGYAFIGQGLVEEVLALRPEDRRALVEEAADVRRHRLRLEEARGRLAATRENLDRVNLLLAEIGPTLGRLERQAERAMLHSQLSRELEQALQALYGHLWREAQDYLTAALAASDQKQEEYRQAETRIATYQEGLQALQKAIEKRRREIEERTQAERRLSDDVRRLEHQLALDEERQRLLGDRRQELRSDIESLEAERERQSQRAAGGGERQAALDEEVERCRAQLVARRQELTEAEREHAELRRGQVEAEEQALRLETSVRETEGRIERLKRAQEGLANELAEIEGRRKESLRRLGSLAQDFLLYHNEKRRLERELADAADAQTSANARIAEARAAILRAEEQVPRLQAQVQHAEARLEILGRVQAQYEGFEDAVRMLLVAAGRIPPADDDDYPEPGSLQGVLGIMARLVRVAPGLEKAIEAALAESLQAIVLESYTDALAVMELLRQYQNGRVTMYALDSLKVSRPLVLLKEKGILGVASDLVSCEARYRPLVETLLGRTIVVETLPLAQKVVRRGLGNVVTLDGELLRPSGAMTSGTIRSAGELVRRESELHHLPEQASQAKAELEGLQKEIEVGRETVKECEATLAKEAARQQRLWQERAGLEQSLVEYRSRLASVGGQLNELRRESARAAQSARQLVTEVKTLERERDAMLGEAKAARERAERQEEAVAALSERLPALTEAVSNASVALAAVEGERQAVALRQEEQQAALARVDGQLEQKRAQLSELEKSLSMVARRLQDSRLLVLKQREQLESVTRVQGPGQEELAQLESREKTLRAELERALAQRLEAERFLLEAQAQVKLKSDELKALQENMEAEGLMPTPTGDVVPIKAEPAREVPVWLSGGVEGGMGREEFLPPIQGGAPVDPVALRETISELRARIRALGPVDAQAPADYAERRQRYDFLAGQVDDLKQAERSLQEVIAQLETKIRERFGEVFQQVNGRFQEYFATFFQGGSARLMLTGKDGDEPGVDIVAQPPGKRVSSLSMLSGGERALTSVALLFALLQTRPSPFCLLDEVDAMLDEANVGRFVDAVRKLSRLSQFILVTHNRRTIEMADHIYGVSMGQDSVSRVLSLRLADVPN